MLLCDAVIASEKNFLMKHLDASRLKFPIIVGFSF